MSLMEGKVAVITGAGGGIGAATAELLAKEGAKVVVNDLGGPRDGSGSDASAADEVVARIRESGGEAVADAHSVATPSGAQGILDSALQAFGRVDVWINNAGILRDKTLLKLEESDWDAVIDVHLKGSFLCTQVAARQLRAQGGGGSIINTTSVSGMLGNFGQTNYSAAKAGIYGLTRTASIELQRFEIRVNAVAPIAKTRMTEDLPMFAKVDSMTPDHVAPVHLFLGSDLSREVTGQVLTVAGGKLAVYKVVESPGRFKEGSDGIWEASEIAEHFASITKL
ncbi:MAG: SDR family NAD(P)-dependent oxidoreductase [Polyangiaceae bacterium]|nr:SDR family NAD(P)-dependent oxidoreductase [Polyangiaceae bacterium]